MQGWIAWITVTWSLDHLLLDQRNCPLSPPNNSMILLNLSSFCHPGISLAAFQTRNPLLGYSLPSPVFFCSSPWSPCFCLEVSLCAGGCAQAAKAFPAINTSPWQFRHGILCRGGGVVPSLGSVSAVKLEGCSCGCLLTEISRQCQVWADWNLQAETNCFILVSLACAWTPKERS